VALVLGYVDTDPQGDIETWYSAKGEVIKLQRGRIIGTIGLTTDWREVRSSAIPKWGDLPATGFEYQRERDEMPGYRMGVRERITLARISAPTNSRLRSLDQVACFGLRNCGWRSHPLNVLIVLRFNRRAAGVCRADQSIYASLGKMARKEPVAMSRCRRGRSSSATCRTRCCAERRFAAENLPLKDGSH
jgi:hypothetical protein